MENLASLMTLSSLTLSGACAQDNKLPASIVDLTLAGPDVEDVDLEDVQQAVAPSRLATLGGFSGQLLSLCLDPIAMADLGLGLSEISAVQSLSRLTYLSLSILGQQYCDRGVSQACFPELQTLNLFLSADEVPLWDFSLCPVLCRLELDVGLACTGGRRTLDLTHLTGMRARQLALETVDSDHVLHIVSNFLLLGPRDSQHHCQGPRNKEHSALQRVQSRQGAVREPAVGAAQAHGAGGHDLMQSNAEHHSGPLLRF